MSTTPLETADAIAVPPATATEAVPRRRLQGNALGIDIAAVMTSSAATGVLGFVFWTVAARGYDTAEVGRASAIITSATLIAILANFSLGSLYERFLPLAGNTTSQLVRSGSTFVAGAAVAFGAIFVVLGPREQLFPDVVEMILFPVFVAILAVYALQDQILIGLGRARTIAPKNIGQSTAKLIVIAALIPVATGAAIVWSWVLPAAVITAIVSVLVIRRETGARAGVPDLPGRRELWDFFMSSYAINAINVIVPLVVPLIVVAQLGTEMNAYFSMCWLVVNTLGALIVATAAPFIATASTPGADLRSCTIRFVLLCGGSSVAGCLVLLAAAPLILGILGAQYAENGTTLIRIMALVLPAVALTTIYTALARLQRRLRLAVAAQVVLGIVVVCGVILTTPLWGIDAVGYTYLAAELLITLVVLLPAIVLLRKALATPTGRALDAESAAAQVRPDPANDGSIEYDSVAERFAQISAERPDRVALVTEQAVIGYGALSAAAAGWCSVLRGRPDPSAPVALVGDLDPHTAAVVLGAFAAGAPLVPLDPGLPNDRMTHIFDALEATEYRLDTVVVDDMTYSLTSELGAGYTVWPADRTLPSHHALPDTSHIGVDSLTSIQFTSGSSGEPKAVLHKNGTWLSDWILHRDRFGLVADARVALCMPVSFAAGLNVMIGALLSGAEIIALDPRRCTPSEALDRIDGADIVMCTPSFLQSLNDAADGRTLEGVRRIVTTGEPVYGNVLRGARELAPNAVLTNWAGSSETLGIAHFDVWPGDEIPAGVVPAGIAVPHKSLAVTDDGRLTVTSRYLATGYLKPESASTEFVDNPDGSATFVTNDRARIADDGVLVVLGRMDSAVKIRGYLVEPAEVEAALLDCPGVREALIVADQVDEAPVLTAYISPMPGIRSPAVADVRAQLHTRLPAWMVPTHVVMIESLPRNERGKVDRRALPPPVRGPITPPADGLEAEIAETWSEVLRLDEVGRDENFYALGGDSLNVQQMISAVGERHGIKFTASDLASAPTVAQFTEVVAARNAGVSLARRIAPTTVLLRPPSEASERTLFCFAGAGASALSFVPFTDRVDADTAVVAFQAEGLENRAFPDWTVGRAARRHLRDLLALQPSGPYTLVGHSLGAFIALDAANRLTAMGHEVELVVLLDPFLPPRTVRAARKTLPGVRSTLLEQTPANTSALWRNRLFLPLAGIVDGTPEQKVEALREVGVRVGRLHRPDDYAGRTLLVLSSFNGDDDRVWPRVLTGDLEIERVHCDHDSVVREPHIGRVADLIRTSLASRR